MLFEQLATGSGSKPCQGPVKCATIVAGVCGLTLMYCNLDAFGTRPEYLINRREVIEYSGEPDHTLIPA